MLFNTHALPAPPHLAASVCMRNHKPQEKPRLSGWLPAHADQSPRQARPPGGPHSAARVRPGGASSAAAGQAAS